MWRPSTLVGIGVLLAAIIGVAVALQPPSQTPGPLTAPTEPVAEVGCAELVGAYVAAVDGELDRLAEVTPLAFVDTEGGTALADAADTLRRGIGEQRCTPEGVVDELGGALGELDATGPVARSVLARLRATTEVGLDPTALATEAVVEPGQDVLAAAAGVAPGGTLRLAAGEHRLDGALVLLGQLRLVGDGVDTTRLVGVGRDAVVLSAVGVLDVASLEVAHEGDEPAHVLVAAGGAFSLDRARVTGAVAAATDGDGPGDATAEGGAGLLVAATQDDQPIRTMSATEVVDNEREGLALAAGGSATVRDSTFARNGTCGVCVLGGDLVLLDATLRDNDVGIAVDDGSVRLEDVVTSGHTGAAVAVGGDASPVLRRLSSTDDELVVQYVGTGGGTVEGLEVRGAGTVAVVVGGSATPRLVELDVEGSREVGVQVQQDAAPTIEGGRIATTGEVGLLWLGAATGTVDGTRLLDQRVGAQLGGTAAPAVTELEVRDVADAAVVVTEQASGTLSGTDCDDAPTGVLLLEQASPSVDGDDCPVTDGR